MSYYLYKVYQKIKFDKDTNACEVESWQVHRLNTETLEIYVLSNLLGTRGSIDLWMPVYPSMMINLSEMTDFLTVEEAIHYLEKNGQKQLSSKLMNHI